MLRRAHRHVQSSPGSQDLGPLCGTSLFARSTGGSAHGPDRSFGVSVAESALVAVGDLLHRRGDGRCLLFEVVGGQTACRRLQGGECCLHLLQAGLKDRPEAVLCAFHSTCQNPRAEGTAANLAARQRIDIQVSGLRTVIGAIARFVPSVVGCPEVKDQ
jgi:hypothetical protein